MKLPDQLKLHVELDIQRTPRTEVKMEIPLLNWFGWHLFHVRGIPSGPRCREVPIHTTLIFPIDQLIG